MGSEETAALPSLLREKDGLMLEHGKTLQGISIILPSPRQNRPDREWLAKH